MALNPKQFVGAVVQFIRRADTKPDACTLCGCLVAPEDQQRHRDWHHNKENK